ncbi:hypothetical protein LK09_17085 [Microbacterium mangrovi]|uniref:Uncharacterized protein n=1 Tax=Microbacterium mangrovi TaxID=1348253 RepID=A0A0B2A385_9MICO|nr:hypothetical protein [Microbacterium mangrovi]KHK96057.1 hypothetical protein LK09_17085 [Microbacterium mangrovi]
MSTGGVARSEPHITILGILAGAGVGLLAGAAVLGIATSGGSTVLGAVNALGYLLAGYLVLLPTTLAVGVPVLRRTRRHSASPRATLLVVGLAGLGLAVVASVVAGLLTYEMWPWFLALIPATIWCLAPALLFSQVLSRHPRVAVCLVALVGVLAGLGALYFGIQLVIH